MKQQVGRRQQVLDALRGTRDARTVNQLAREVGVHGNTVRFHLESLLADGLIEVEEDSSGERAVGRPAVKYRAVARVAPSQMRHAETLLRLLLGDLSEDPGGARRAERIGENWGRRQAGQMPLAGGPRSPDDDADSLAQLLTEMGFEADPPRGGEILIKACPFLNEAEKGQVEAARTFGAGALPPVCALHLGVMAGALEEWDADIAVAGLIPFARQDRCQIQVQPRESQ